MFIKPVCNFLKAAIEPRFPKIAYWIFGTENKARKLIVLSQEEYNKHVEANFLRKLKQTVDDSLQKESKLDSKKRV
jgi:hypothetical protein